jgi:hypothetical protein
MPASRHAVDPVVAAQDAVVFGISAQAFATALAEGNRPVEFGAREIAIGVGAGDLRVQCIGREAAAQRHGDDMLHQHVQRLLGRTPLLHAAAAGGLPRGSRFDQFQGVGRDQRHAAGPAWRVAAAAGALHHAGHALGRTDLQHALHRQEVHAQVQRGGGHHGAQRAFLQALLHPFARGAVQRAVVQGDATGPFGFGLQQQLVPDLRLRAHVGEDQRRAGSRDLVHHRLLHARTEVAGPGVLAGIGRDEGVDEERLVDAALDEFACRPSGMTQHLHGFREIAQRRAQAPGDQRRIEAPQPRDRQLRLHAALAADQLVPFVHHHELHLRQLLARVLAREHQGQRLRRGDQDRGHAAVLLRPFSAARVAGAQADGPSGREIAQRPGECRRGIGSQRPHGREPDDPQRLGGALRGMPRQQCVQHAQPNRIGLAGAGGRMQQAAAAFGDGLPHLALEGKGLPAAPRDPGFAGGRGGLAGLAQARGVHGRGLI